MFCFSGPIPAHAGQPRGGGRAREGKRAYPRSRGATARRRRACRRQQGLSPLTRGNRFLLVAVALPGGPIPAHAGQPRPARRCGTALRAYPRSRGATRPAASACQAERGLSPLTRGNPPTSETSWPSSPAYPRSRGATLLADRPKTLDQGLSPLTRGNQFPRFNRTRRSGPIPAHAGQPSWRSADERLPWAYPRSRGATGFSVAGPSNIRGLSPLTRGNLSLNQGGALLHGPIPAHAGQPWPRRSTSRLPGAYPRSRGATRAKSRFAFGC